MNRMEEYELLRRRLSVPPDALEGCAGRVVALCKDAGQSDYHKRYGVNQSLLNEERHADSPPFSTSAPPPPSGGLAAASAAGRATLLRRFRWPLMNILMTREKALR